MTTITDFDVTCSVCGEKETFMGLGSSNTLGFPDLDMRPAPMLRDTIDMWIQRCPNCGYCAPNIGRAVSGAKAVVGSDDYLAQLNDPDFPKLANSFLCWGIICAKRDHFGGAANAALQAAWVCDDSGKTEPARLCRQRALQFFEQMPRIDDTEKAIMVDLMRRSGQFERALSFAEQALTDIRDADTRQVLSFQLELARQQDANCHTTAEIFENQEPPGSILL